MRRIPKAYWRIEQAIALATKVTPTMSDMPHGTGVSSKVEDGAIAIMQAKEAYRKFVDELSCMQNELIPLIEQLDDPMERAAMRLRYIDKMTIKDIAIAIDRCDRHTKRVIQHAEKKIYDLSQNVLVCPPET